VILRTDTAVRRQRLHQPASLARQLPHTTRPRPPRLQRRPRPLPQDFRRAVLRVPRRQVLQQPHRLRVVAALELLHPLLVALFQRRPVRVDFRPSSYSSTGSTMFTTFTLPRRRTANRPAVRAWVVPVISTRQRR